MAFDHEDGITSTSSATNPLSGFPAGTFPPAPPPFPIYFKAAHMALIPKGECQGMVLVWDEDPILGAPPPGQPSPTGWFSYQPYAIVDPSPTSPLRFRNFLLPIGPVQLDAAGHGVGGDLFCSGHCWSPYGDLIVVGGTDFKPNPMGGFDIMAAMTTFVFNPTEPSLHYAPQKGLWIQGPDLQTPRWYPTATLTAGVQHLSGDQAVLVLGGDTVIGGNATVNPTWNSYEALDVQGPSTANPPLARIAPDTFLIAPGSPAIWPGPAPAFPNNPNLDSLRFYPRTHLLTTGKAFMSAFVPLSSAVIHESVSWELFPGHATVPGNWNNFREYGASVHFPISGYQNLVARIGGKDTTVPGQFTTNTVEVCIADSPSASWAPVWGMNLRRCFLNVVILPDLSLLAIGGADEATGTAPIYHLQPELYQPGSTGWQLLPPAASPRQYHSTALLLPDGRVLTGGGEGRTVGYEVFSPPYLTGTGGGIPVRPTGVTITNPLFHDAVNRVDVLQYDTLHTVQIDALPLGLNIERAVLMAPGSTTHHSDMHQRYHQLQVKHNSPTSVQIRTPLNSTILPKGYFMLILVTNTGIPSTAVWVRLQ